MSGTFELNPTFSFTLLGTFAIYAWMRPSRSSWLAVLIITLGLRLARIRLIGGLGTYFGVWWIGWGAFLGVASLIVLAVQVGRPGDRVSDSERKLRRGTFYAAAVFPVCSLLNNCTVPLSNWVRPRAYAHFCWRLTGVSGFNRVLWRDGYCHGVPTRGALPPLFITLCRWQPVFCMHRTLEASVPGNDNPSRFWRCFFP